MKHILFSTFPDTVSEKIYQNLLSNIESSKVIPNEEADIRLTLL